MLSAMKRLLLLALLASLASAARAEWADLKAGMDQATAIRCVGLPLIQQNKGRGGTATWTYDFGGCIQLQYGRVLFWTAPKPPKAIPHGAPTSIIVTAPATKARPSPDKPAAARAMAGA